MTNKSIVIGSIGAMAMSTGKSIAETFLSADVIVLVDTSGSMNAHDAREGKSRYEVACDELSRLQNTMPGKIAVIAFSNAARFCPDGIPQFFGDTTNLTGALKFVKVADLPDMRFVIISDGQPDSMQSAEEVAATFTNRFDCIYVGPEGGIGQEWLNKLARLHGGSGRTAAKAQDLAEVTLKLLGR
jgi:hypothetical protein